MEEKKKVLVVYGTEGESHSLANSVMSLYAQRKKYTAVEIHFLCLYTKSRKSLSEYIRQHGIFKVYIHDSLLNDIMRLSIERVPYTIYKKEYVNSWRLYWSIVNDEDGKPFSALWGSTTEWERAMEYENVLYGARIGSLNEDRLRELQKLDMADIRDQKQMCDWANPHSVKEIVWTPLK